MVPFHLTKTEFCSNNVTLETSGDAGFAAPVDVLQLETVTTVNNPQVFEHFTHARPIVMHPKCHSEWMRGHRLYECQQSIHNALCKLRDAKDNEKCCKCGERVTPLDVFNYSAKLPAAPSIL